MSSIDETTVSDALLKHRVDAQRQERHNRMETLALSLAESRKINRMMDAKTQSFISNLENINDALKKGPSDHPSDPDMIKKYAGRIKDTFLDFIASTINIILENASDAGLGISYGCAKTVMEKVIVFTQTVASFMEYNPIIGKQFSDSIPIDKIKFIMSHITPGMKLSEDEIISLKDNLEEYRRDIIQIHDKFIANLFPPPDVEQCQMTDIPADQSEIVALRAEVAQLRQEMDELKKYIGLNPN